MSNGIPFHLFSLKIVTSRACARPAPAGARFAALRSLPRARAPGLGSPREPAPPALALRYSPSSALATPSAPRFSAYRYHSRRLHSSRVRGRVLALFHPLPLARLHRARAPILWRATGHNNVNLSPAFARPCTKLSLLSQGTREKGFPAQRVRSLLVWRLV